MQPQAFPLWNIPFLGCPNSFHVMCGALVRFWVRYIYVIMWLATTIHKTNLVAWGHLFCPVCLCNKRPQKDEQRA